MSLYSKGVGLFNTHVTWNDIEKVIQKQLNTTATFGEKKTIRSIGDGKGFLSTICLIHADWQNVREGGELPHVFAAKLPSLINLLGVMESMAQLDDPTAFYDNMEIHTKKVHNIECDVYTLMKKYSLEIPAAKMFCASKFSSENSLKGLIIMEYKDNIVSVSLYDNLSIKAVMQPLRAVAKWSAMSLKFTKEEKEIFVTKPYRQILSFLFDKDDMSPLLNEIRKFGSGELVEQADKMEKIIPHLHDIDFFDSIPDSIGMTRVLCHGDTWSPNMIWTKENNQHQLAAIVDFQTSHFGSPAIDINRILCSSLSGKDRKENFEYLVRYYYEQFMEGIDKEAAPFTFEQIFESCQRLMPMSTYMIISMVPTIFNGLYGDADEETKNRAINLAIEKMTVLFEDMFFYNHRNDQFKQS